MRDNVDRGIRPEHEGPAGRCGTTSGAGGLPPAVGRPRLPDPRAVLDDDTLTREQKIEKLRRWSVDARRVEASNDDGLQGAVTPSNLPAIQAALRELGAGEDPAVEQPGINA
jgi:hypothetical protein